MANTATAPKGIVRNLVTGVVRVAFPHLSTKNEGGQYPSNKYEVHGLFSKTAPCPTPDGKNTTDALRAAALAAAQEKWGAKVTLADLVIGIRDGDEKANLDGFPGAWFICAKSGRPVPVYGPAREELTADAVQGGDYCRLLLSAGAYKRNLEPEVAQALREAGRKVVEEKDPQTKKVSYWRPAVTFYLNAVQLVRRGEPMGGGANPGAFPVEDDVPMQGANQADSPFG